MKKSKTEVDFDNMKYFDEEERDLIESFENSNVEVKPISKAEKKKWQAIAAYSIEQRKKQALSLRLRKGDISLVKREAARKGLPYQTLIASIVHQYVTGELTAK